MTTGNIKTFRDLLIWQKAIQLAKQVYDITKAFPRDERFGLTSQIRRAVVSVSSNIAEGHSRQGREFAHFLSIARGSLAEVESQLYLACELGFLTLTNNHYELSGLRNPSHDSVAGRKTHPPLTLF